MGPTRFPFGQAVGFANQFYTNKGVGGIAAGLQVAGTAGDISGQTTPDVTIGGLFYTNNTAALSITNFVLQDTANRLAQYEGKVIRIFFLDTATQINAATNILMMSSDNMLGANSISDFELSNGKWFQILAARPSTTGGISIFSGAGTTSFNANATNTIVFQGTGATTLQSISGGQVGQSVVILQNTGGIALTINTAGNILIPGTNSIVLSSAGANYTLTRFGTNWFLDRGAV